MCGIAAYFAPERQFEHGSILDFATHRLAHRGPDGRGQDTSGRAAVAHTRLAIVDVAGGEQPMRGNDNRYLMVCNGEIYNHLAIRAWLGDRYEFRTRSDSEVVLPLYEELGPACVGELDGMFAFFASDGDRFVAARDPFGIKPLYFGPVFGGFLFASEQKAVADWCTSFQALPPGSYITETGSVRRWFSPTWTRRIGTVSCVAPDAIARRLEVAVVKRLMSDVPIGVFLSGGLDSSIIAELVSRHCPNLKTFSVGLEGATDLAAARIVASALGTRHFERIYSVEEAVSELERIIYHLESYDVELIRSAIPCYFLSKLAAEHVRVALTGEGADEVFGGYAHFGGITEPGELHRECVKLLLGLHCMNLQRVDRMTMAHGLEGRVPFLDVSFVDWAMSIDPRLKLWGGNVPEKQLLRAAFAGRLPKPIVRRKKAEFSRGSGADRALLAHASQKVSDGDLRAASVRFPVDPPATKEEYLYRAIFEDLFPGEAWRASVARWRPAARSLAAS